MSDRYTYLLINLLSVFFPVILSFDKKVHFYKSWKYLIPAILTTGVVFLVWDYVFTITNVWSFNPRYITGRYFLRLPLEEILFFLTIPFACVFIYECLRHYVVQDLLQKSSRMISFTIALGCAVALIFYHDRIYSLINFGFLFLLLLVIILSRVNYMGRFYLAYFVSLIPFYIVNGILTSLPVVSYNNAENMTLRVGTIPFEDHFYLMSMLLMNVALLEFFRRKSHA